MTLSAPPCPHLAAIGLATVGGAPARRVFRPAAMRLSRPRWLRRLQAARGDAHFSRTEAARPPRSWAVHPFTKEHVMFKVSRSRSSAIHQPSNAAYAGGAPAGNAESAAASAGRRRCVEPQLSRVLTFFS